MSVERKRLLSLVILFALTLILPGTWWIYSGQIEPGERVVAGSAPAGMERPGFIERAAPGPVEPVVVDLWTIAPGQLDPNNKYHRWLRGEVDFSKRNRIVSAERFKSLKNASRQLAPSFDVQVADDAIGPSAPAPVGEFDSIDYLECCGPTGGNVPPDPEMAAGPEHLIAVVNVAFEIYDKAGASLRGPTTFSSFMGVNPRCTNVFDPNALYDEEADRFILGVDAGGGFYCAAVSQTGDPTGLWNIYAFPTASGADFFDYPHAGVGRDAIYVGANIFDTFGFSEGRVYALDKTAMYAANPAQYVTRGLGSIYDTPQPLNLHGWDQGTWPDSGPHYFFSDKNFNGRTYAILSWDDPFGANTLTEAGEVDLNAATGVTAGMPLNVPQMGGGTVDGGDWRPQDFEYRNGFGWTAMTIACNPGGDTVNCVRWAQIDLATRTVVDAGVYASNGTYRSYADLAANDCGDMAVGYTKSSSSMYPGIWYTGRIDGDPAGILQPETELKIGELPYIAFDGATYRWGDYTGMTIDPDGETFWYLGEYSKNTGTSNGLWGTYIGSFSFNCDATPQLDTTPPVRSNGQPSGTLPAGTPEATLSLSTDEAATCGYSTTAGKAFGALETTTFTTANGLFHQSTVSVANGLSYDFFVRCQDGEPLPNANTDDFPISFSVAATGTPPSVTSIVFAPLGGADTVFGEVTITATATDDTGVVQVEFFIDGVSIHVDTTAGDWSASWNTASGAYSNGSHTVKAVAADDDGDTGQLVVEVTVDNGSVAAALHIADLDGAVSSSGRNWQANVTATVHDVGGEPVSGAVVDGEWSGDVSGLASCATVTDTNGMCDVTSGDIPKKKTNNAVFTVDDITVDDITLSLTYDPTANWDPDGDSNGTAIQVNKDGTTQNLGNQPPSAGFSFTVDDLYLIAQFTNLSSDSDGTIDSWLWAFGDGDTSPAQSPSHTYAKAGMYSVSLTVTDNVGAIGTDTQTVPVDVDAATAPMIDGCSPADGVPNDRITVMVTGAGFQDGATVDFGDRIAVQGVAFNGLKELAVRIKIHRQAADGPRIVTVTNPDGGNGNMAACFTVNVN